ncbi:MAG: hypothetical protein IT307_08095 [Chloroflexi bacterium]|nr:hypothetical protein [Chloroflexota bacterium]
MTAHTLILPRHLYEGTDPKQNDFNFKPVGTGPFKFVEWVKGDHISFERNPSYYKPDLPYLDRLVFKIIPDDASRVAALRKGEIDYLVYAGFPPSAYKDLSQADGVSVVVDRNRPSFGMVKMFMNVRQPTLQSPDVRHAIAYAIDRQAIVDRALEGLADPGSGPISSQMKTFYNPDLPKYPPNAATANQLLDQAGFPKKPDGSRFDLRLSYQRAGESGAMNGAAEIMREQLRPVGINLVLQPLDLAAWTESAYIKWDFDLTLGSFQTGPDPAYIATNYLSANIERRQGGNLMGYSNPTVDQLFKLGEREIDNSKRVGIYKELQTVMVQDLPDIGLWEKVAVYGFRKTVHGLPGGVNHQEPYEAIWQEAAGGQQPSVPTTYLAVGVLAFLAIGALAVGRARARRRRT